MNIRIGAKIVALRHEQRVTQDMLAVSLGVTPQAISRWESENGYPDIELLPAIASFFSVSIDELLGYRQSEREKELTSIHAEIKRLKEVGTIEERIRFARESLIRFPGDDMIKEELAISLYFQWSEKREEAARIEAEALFKSVMENSANLDLKYDAVFSLIAIYKKGENPEKALQTAEFLMPMRYCREFALSSGIGDGKTEWYIQDEIDKLTDHLGRSIWSLVLNEDLPNDESTWDKKIKMLEISNEIYKVIYGDNLFFYHVRLSRNYWLISTYLIAQGKKYEAINALEKMCEHGLAYDHSYKEDRGKSYTSILTDKLIYPESGEAAHELTEHNECYYLLNLMKDPRYDGIRDEDRFAAVVRKLENVAE
ncbi:MAG: helix-turn-helix transcriptional regulator [Oscillospiraceae bacterium]|nr:helix-turn-helix transcriptional regulator [Oscillospiraceae bacterium]